MCSVIDGEGKKHNIFISEGQGLIKGWDLLTAKLRDLGIKEKLEEGRVDKEKKKLHVEKEIRGKEGENKRTLSSKILCRSY